MLFIFCCVYVKRVPSYYQPEQNPWASKFQSWNPSPLWCCKMINATEVTRLEMILKLPTEGELWHFSVGLWAEEVGDFHCKLPPFFFCHRSRPSLPLLRNMWTHSTPQCIYMMCDSLSLFFLGIKTGPAYLTPKAELSNPSRFTCLSCITPLPKSFIWLTAQLWDCV